MKKLIMLLFLLVTVVLINTSCTENVRTRQFGGTSTIELPQNTKLVNVTWKEADLWVLTTAMSPTDVPKTYTFYEESSWEVWEGTIHIVEKPYISNLQHIINKETSCLYLKELLLNKTNRRCVESPGQYVSDLKQPRLIPIRAVVNRSEIDKNYCS